MQELGVRVPIVIRMEGTNVEEGKRLLRESGLNFTTADSMGEAADKVVSLARGKRDVAVLLDRNTAADRPGADRA